MKKSIILLFLLLTITSGFAQKAEPQIQTQTEISNNYPISLGPYILLKGGVNASDVPQGVKNGANFNAIPDFGATFYYPFTKEAKIGATLDLGYSTYSYQLKYTGLEDYPWKNKFGYLTINPNLHLYGFMLGINFGIPMSASIDYSGNNAMKMYEIWYDSKNLNTLITVCVGFMLPIYVDNTGRVNLVLKGEYALSGQNKDDYNFEFGNKALTSSNNNPHPASIAVGFNYLFHLQKVEHVKY
jgi:hypothetical protein